MLLHLAEREGTVIASPSYRLLPEAKYADILCDLEDFWRWIHQSFDDIVPRWNGVRLDPTRMVAAGEGGGGFLALQSALLWPQA
jgi:acetyl esterase/lipase